jgi:hypothetical protein
MNWLIAPLSAALILGVSGWLDAIERTTELSRTLAARSETAPEDTAAAAERVAVLPIAAELTDQQAVAFTALVDALEVSARRVLDLNATLGDQVRSVARLPEDLRAILASIDCIKGRIAGLRDVTNGVPPVLGRLDVHLHDLVRAQNKSIRHLKSINRKLAALGVAAAATRVEPPKPPPPGPTPEPGSARRGRPC